ncbi:MAG TPA: hypothetical protein VFN51_00805 [Candidatus Saccharimonadales bacterium]|nr:hypothetical protein [Candidatus Saccharimonadales bacterium]
MSFTSNVSQQFSDLAQAFLHGHLNFLSPIGGVGRDPILYHGKIYWGEGPFPAILLMPFVGLFNLFHIFYAQGYIQWALIAGVVFLVYKLARLIGYVRVDSYILMLGFTLGSVFMGVAAFSSGWLFAQVVITFLLFWALYEFLTRKRWWLLGAISGMILMTRVPAACLILFFVLEIWQERRPRREAARIYLKFFVPVVVAGTLLALYNVARFHSPFNGGFAYQLLPADSAVSRSEGLFSVVHIPANLFSFLFGAPITVHLANTWTLKAPFIENNPYGLSIFLTSPYFAYLLSQKWSAYSQRSRNLLVAIGVSFVLVMSFYGIGRQQLGYRYSLDFLPELFVVFMIVYKASHERLSKGMKALLILPIYLNFYLFWTYI